MKTNIATLLLIVTAFSCIQGCGNDKRKAKFTEIQDYIDSFEPELHDGGATEIFMKPIPSKNGGKILVAGSVNNQEEYDLLKAIILHPVVSPAPPGDIEFNVEIKPKD
jgi:hypothetical protein